MKLVSNIKAAFATSEQQEQWAWCMYDFAKSAFESVLGVFLGPYIVYLAQQQACITNSEAGCYWCDTSKYCLSLYDHTNSSLTECKSDSCWDSPEMCCETGGDYVHFVGVPIAYGAFYAFAVSASVVLQVICLPLFGTLGDVYNPKKFLIGSTIVAGTALICMFLTYKPELFWLAALLTIITNVAYGITNIFYNASLLYVASADERDDISSRGFAVGYAGAVLFLLVCLAIYLSRPVMHTTVILCVLTGVWWLVWAIIPFVWVRSTQPKGGQLSSKFKYFEHDTNIFTRARKKFVSSLQLLTKVKQTALFLVACALYNNGISTITSQSAVYATSLLHATSLQMLLIVVVLNISAIFGAILFNKLAKKIGTKYAIVASVIFFVLRAIYVYFMEEAWELWITGFLLGIAVGGSQSLSRSLLAVMIPTDYESEMFSFYELTLRGTSWIGPLIYGLITTAYDNNPRPAMLSMTIFLVSGAIVLLFVNVEKGKEQALHHTHSEDTNATDNLMGGVGVADEVAYESLEHN